MIVKAFFEKIRQYSDLSTDAEHAWKLLLRPRHYVKGEVFIRAGDVPSMVAFVDKGLLCQYYVGPDGDMHVQHFYSEGKIAASVSATLLCEPSCFTLTAIEDSTILEYDFVAFRKLTDSFPDIMAFYILYMERHWIIEREPERIVFRHHDALSRYLDFIRNEPELHKRLKQHHIAAWLGIAPESLSRLRKKMTAILIQD